MASRLARALSVTLMLAGLALLPSAATADEPPDTTAPQVDLNPCHEATSCRRVYAQVFGWLEPGDDLAVLGARIDDRVVVEHVFDDGSGFEPYGWFAPYGNDVHVPVDYALSVKVPVGTSEITFYARDLEGNTSELTTTVLGPIPPGPVRRLRAEVVGAREVRVSWGLGNRHGSCCTRYAVRTPGRQPKVWFSRPPSLGMGTVTYRRLSTGWHRFRVVPSTEGGKGPSRTVRVLVPRRTG